MVKVNLQCSSPRKWREFRQCGNWQTSPAIRGKKNSILTSRLRSLKPNRILPNPCRQLLGHEPDHLPAATPEFFFFFKKKGVHL